MPARLLRIQVLGHVRATFYGEAYSVATPGRTAELLAYLLLHRGATVSRNFLAFLLWPDESEEAARSKLRFNLFTLLRLLPPTSKDEPWIHADGTSLRWNAELDVAVDVEEFEAAVTARELDDAVGLYGGDLLEGLYDEWLLAPRERLRSAYLASLSELVTQARRRTDFPAAIAHAKRLLHADPLREDVARRLVAIRYESGDRAGALDEYGRFVERLREELGIEPMPETSALHAVIVRNEGLPAAERSDDDGNVQQRRRTQLPFIGRADELSRLLDGWNRARRGRGGIAFVDGAPGIGKSRLVAELARAVEERGGRVLSGMTGLPEAMPYQSFLEALRGALPLLTAAQYDPVTLAVLATLMPELEHLVDGVAPLRPLAPQSERERTLAALAQAFVALAQPRPLLLVLEDLHWAQDATIGALAVLVRRTALAPIFIVATYRDGDVPRRHPLRHVRAEALRAGWAGGVSLGPLPSDAVAEIARRVGSALADAPPALHAACAGNPLLLDQLLAGLTADVSNLRELRIGAIVGAQLERLSQPARSFAEIAALVGARFSQEIVCEAGGWDAPSATRALDELLDRKIVMDAGGAGEFDYAFAHQLVRDVVAENAPARRAADRHRRIARAIEALFPEREVELAGELARHYEHAGDVERAASRYLTGAERALQMSALEEAHSHLERALALASDPHVRVHALIELIEVSRRADNPVERAAALSALEQAADALDDDEYRRKSAWLRVRFSVTQSDAAATSAARARLRSVALDASPRWRAVCLIEEARAAFGEGDLAEAGSLAAQALDAARSSGDLATIARALIVLARVHRERGDYDAAVQLLEDAADVAFRAGDGAVEVDAMAATHRTLYEAERLEEALSVAERCVQRAQSLGDRYAEAFARGRLAYTLCFLRRDVQRALDEIDRPLGIDEELRTSWGIGSVIATHGSIYSELGDFARAAACFEEAHRRFEALGDSVERSISLSNLGLNCAWGGDPDRGHRYTVEALGLAQTDYLRASGLENVAITAALCGNLEEAISLGTQALALQERLSGKKWYPRLLADLAVWSGRSGDLAAACRYVDAMLAFDVPLGAETPQNCPWAAAQVLRATGDAAQAQQHLERAYRIVVMIAAQLRGPARKRFDAVPWNREIRAARERDEWPEFA